LLHNKGTLGKLPVAGKYEFDTPLNYKGLDTLQAMAKFGAEAMDDNGEVRDAGPHNAVVSVGLFHGL
jgi:hypothetical protein